MKKNIKQKKENYREGFTLVEIMVAVSIFSIVMMVAIGAVLAIVGANKKAQSLNSVINNLNFAFEGMVRDLRTGYNYECNGNNPGDCITDPGGNSISFFSSQARGNVTYSLDSETHTINRTFKGITSSLTAPEVYIESLTFYVADTEPADALNFRQPKILIILKGYAGSAVKELDGTVAVQNSSRFSLQTLVSQRRLDI